MSQLPPSTRDNWSYSGDFHVEASGNNRHRRATVPELKALFDGTDGAKDRPAHWYEAQLIHYGLPPSKTKGTAKMRLFDAVGKGRGGAQERLDQARARGQAGVEESVYPGYDDTKVTGKRKADGSQVGAPGHNVSINLSVSFGPNGNFQVAPTEPAPKRAKATPAAKPTPAAKKTPAAKETPAAKPTPAAKKTTTGAKKEKAAVPPAPKLPASTPTTTAKKQTARCTSRAGAAAGRTASSRPAAPPTPATTTARAPRAKQTARRSRPFNPATAPGRSVPANPPQPLVESTPTYWDNPYGDDDAPPPYPGSPNYGDDYMDQDDGYGDDGYDDDGHDDDGHDNGYGGNVSYQPRSAFSALPPLGLLNGRYHVSCTSPLKYDDNGRNTSRIIFTLDGNALWGSFEIGPLSGIIFLEERPWESSHEELPIQWRARLNMGDYLDNYSDMRDFIRFSGDGEIDGEFRFYGTTLQFTGRRASGQGTRSEVSSASMKRQWVELGC
ncbi:hypothetical protein B0J18DRAFT_473551 [Chaetomium sp. MPI-SDFR-AT-0129]|nr:hypothetical protein B0J18DRAFT_473551 [Chaetomium sp. MPI-SDFR-AT-0129]